MNKEDKYQQTENHNRQAVEVLRALSHFEYPLEVSLVENWINITKPLQSLVRNLCERDESGRTTLECINEVYELIGINGESVSPAIWEVLKTVEESQVEFIVKTYLKDSPAMLKNALCALITGVCQCGHRIPEIQTWCYAFIKALEHKQMYCVILSISRSAVFKLMHGLILPHTRQLVYSLLERILYPMIYPHVFNMTLEKIPEVLLHLGNSNHEETKKVCRNFCGLVRTLMERFPATEPYDEDYRKIETALAKFFETTYYPPANCRVWNPKHKHLTKISNLLECPVCYERFVTPIMVCENGHCICSNCRKKLKTCPICRAQFSNIRMTIMDQVMEMTEFHCKNFDSGCEVKLPYKDIRDHEVDCEYRTVSCEIMTFYNPSGLVCKEDVVVAYFHKHIETCHKSFVVKYELNSERRGELRRQRANELRLLKTSASNLYFIERIYVTDEEVFFSYHYIGKNEDAKNYVYTLKINGKGVPKKIRYSNFCLPNYMGIFDTEVDERCLILEPEKIFDSQQTKFEYSVKIEDVNAYRLRLNKNKLFVSI